MSRLLTIGVTTLAVVVMAGVFVYVQTPSQQSESAIDNGSVTIVDVSGQSAPLSSPEKPAVPYAAPVDQNDSAALAASDSASEEKAATPTLNNRPPPGPDADGASVPAATAGNASGNISQSVFLSGEIGGLVWNLPEETPESSLSHRALSLRIQGPDGAVLEKTSEGYSAIVLADGLGDGRYYWETITTPDIDPYARDQLREARDSGDYDQYRRKVRTLQKDGFYPTSAELERNSSSGSFLVMNGQLVNADTREN